MRLTLVPWLLYDKWPNGSPREPTWVPDAGGGRDVYGRFSTLDLRPYGQPQAILNTQDYIDPLPSDGGKRLDLGPYLDKKINNPQAAALRARLGVDTIVGGMTVGEAIRELIAPGLVPHRDGRKYGWLHQVNLMDDASAPGGADDPPDDEPDP